MAQHTITMPAFRPVSTNRLYHGHWTTRRKLKRQDEETIAAFCCTHRKAKGRRRVDIVIVNGPRCGRLDPDNCLKSLLDGLVKCGQLTNDDGDSYELGSVISEKGEHTKTVVTLTDLE
jgi:hypothetical protein